MPYEVKDITLAENGRKNIEWAESQMGALLKVRDRFEREKRYFHEAIRQGYLSIAKGDRKRFIVVHGKLREDELESVIFDYVRPFISKEMRVRGS